MRQICLNYIHKNQNKEYFSGIPDSCKDHLKYAIAIGRNDQEDVYAGMKEMCGVTSQEATINDIQRYFKCKDIAKADCNDKGLQFPSKCTTPPCDECGIWNKGITFQSINNCHIFLIL